MANGIIIQIPKPIMTLEGYHDSLRKADGSETIALRTLEEHARDGKLPGAWKQGGIWMVNIIAIIQQGCDFGPPERAQALPRVEYAPQPVPSATGKRDRRKRGQKAPRQEAEKGMPAPLRFPG